jgi:autotransporter-associated beta strand protein
LKATVALNFLQAASLNQNKNRGFLLHWFGLPVLAALMVLSGHAQTLQLHLPLTNNVGNTTLSTSDGTINGLAFTMYNNGTTAVNLITNNTAASGLVGGASLDQTADLTISQGITQPGNGSGAGTGPVLQLLNNGTLATLGHSGTVSSFMVSYWVKSVASPTTGNEPRMFVLSSGGTVGDYNATGNNLGMQLNGTNSMYWSVGGNTLTGTLPSGSFPTNTWMFFAVTYDGVNLVMYYGTTNQTAAQIGTAALANYVVTLGVTASLDIGNSQAKSYERSWNGWISDFRFYNGVAGTAAQNLAYLRNVQSSAVPSVVIAQWTGAASTNWDTTTANWIITPFGGNPAVGDYSDPGVDTVLFNDTASQFAVNLSGTVTPLGVTVSNSINNYTISGAGRIAGVFGLTKSGTGTLNLQTANTYQGGTLVANGTLLVNNTAGSGTGTNTVTVNSGGILGGSGIISGNVTVNSGGLTCPSNGVTTTIGGNLTYNAGTGANFDLSSAASGANDHIILNGAGSVLTCGGVSIGINCGMTLDQKNDYNLFSLTGGSASIVGSFNATPVWLGSIPTNADAFSIVTSSSNVVLHYSNLPPTVTGVFNVGPTNVEIAFSKPVAVTSATNISNYAFTNGVAITGASLSTNNLVVTLITVPLVYGSNYTLVINGVFDQYVPPNLIASNTLASFVALPFMPQDIGNPAIASTVTITANGVSVNSAGYYVGGTNDQFNFEYQLQTGNFDVTVCLAGLGLSDLWAEAGLMARTSLAAGSPFAAALATPGMVGDFFTDRTTTNGTAVTSGNFPVNYPNTWLRLNRVGNVFTGFGSYDGINWTQLGTATIAMPVQIYLGLAVASHNTNQLTTAQFLNYESTPTNAVLATLVNPHEPLGSSTRKTGIVISEVMYKPAPRTDGNNVEFLELYNSNPFFQDISRYQVTCADMNYTFPANTLIPGGAFFVLAASPQGVANVYGLTTNVFGPYAGSLKKSETLQLLDEQSNVLLTVPYTEVYPWPVAADGTGHSIVLANPTYGEGDPRAWAISDVIGGSPGQLDAFTPGPLRQVLINEILPHSENPALPQFIELYNHSTNSVDISGCILTDDPTTNKFVIPTNTLIGPAGFVSFAQPQLGFTLNGAGETLYFIQPDHSRVLDAVQFGAQADGVSYGRWPDGADDFYAFTASTPGTNNSSILIGDIVINELMYDPISGSDDDQYIELYNQGTNTVNLSGWQFTSGVTYTFPTNAFIGPGSYVVVGKDITNLFAKYPNLNAGNTFGNYGGKLSHDGERVTLSMPQTFYVTNTIYVEEDEVTYGTGGRWGEWSGGGGSSLELIDPHANHRLAANWADSDDTAKSVWTNITCTGVLDNGANYDPSIDYAQIGLLDSGECLVDNIEVEDTNGVNYVANGTFDNGLGLTNWSLQGCMVRSSLESTGYQSGYSLHIRSSDKLWTGDNSCQVALNTNSLAAGATATLSFEARWLHGWPEALLRLNGNWLEATAPMPIPNNLGSPGMPNSTYLTNAGRRFTTSPTIHRCRRPASRRSSRPMSVIPTA